MHERLEGHTTLLAMRIHFDVQWNSLLMKIILWYCHSTYSNMAWCLPIKHQTLQFAFFSFYSKRSI